MPTLLVEVQNTSPLVLKFLRTSIFDAEDCDNAEWERIKDLFSYLLIPLPVTEPARVLTWDPSTCIGSICLQEINSSVVQPVGVVLQGCSRVVGTCSVGRFSVRLGSSLGSFTSLSVGFISPEEFKSTLNQAVHMEEWSVNFSIFGGSRHKRSQGVRFLPKCTLTAIYRAKRGEIIIYVTSKDGDYVIECNFHGVPRKELFPFVACNQYLAPWLLQLVRAPFKRWSKLFKRQTLRGRDSLPWNFARAHHFDIPFSNMVCSFCVDLK